MLQPVEERLQQLGFRHDPALDDVDFSSADGRTFVQVKTHLGGTRDLSAEFVRLARLARTPGVERAVLVVHEARISLLGIRREWEAMMSLLTPDVARRLNLVAIIDGKTLNIPEGLTARTLAEQMGTIGSLSAPTRPNRSFEVVKVLLHRWLLRADPIAIQALQATTGLSYPTVAKSLAELDDLVQRSSSRSVSLRSFPSRVWSSLLAQSPRVRQTVLYADASGRTPDLRHTVERLHRLHPPGVATAGVLGARRRFPSLDLDGLPRLDLSVHAPTGSMDLAFVRTLDPALERTTKDHAAVLAVHAVPRAVSLFEDADEGAPWADPVELLLDLQELRLTAQADAFVRHLRSGAQ